MAITLFDSKDYLLRANALKYFINTAMCYYLTQL